MDGIRTSSMNEQSEKFKKGLQTAKEAEDKIVSGIKGKLGNLMAR